MAFYTHCGKHGSWACGIHTGETDTSKWTLWKENCICEHDDASVRNHCEPSLKVSIDETYSFRGCFPFQIVWLRGSSKSNGIHWEVIGLKLIRCETSMHGQAYHEHKRWAFYTLWFVALAFRNEELRGANTTKFPGWRVYWSRWLADGRSFSIDVSILSRSIFKSYFLIAFCI